jgi:Phage ABA sandwich domain
MTDTLNELVLSRVMRPQRMFTPATNVADAMSVVLEMESRGWGWRMYSRHDQGLYVVVMFRTNDAHATFARGCQTLPHAICRVALLACGVDESEVDHAAR